MVIYYNHKVSATEQNERLKINDDTFKLSQIRSSVYFYLYKSASTGNISDKFAYGYWQSCIQLL